MAILIVAGVTIPIAPTGASRQREDRVDRARAIDGTMHATQIGTAKRSWPFTTPPITRANADTYETTLGAVAAQTCSGDILGGSVSCFTEITDWQAVQIPSGHRVVLSFALHEA